VGIVEETAGLTHRILAPPGAPGRIEEIREGDVTIADPVVFFEPTRLYRLFRQQVRDKTINPAEKSERLAGTPQCRA